MYKDMLFDDEARKSIREGVRKLARAVKATLGPTGKNVVIKKKGADPVMTKDGVTVAREVELEEKFERVGAELIRGVASKTALVAGDGTTTATVLAEAILDEGLRQLSSGSQPVDLKKGIDKAVAVVEQALEEMSRPVTTKDKMAQVASISANNDKEIGDLLADVLFKVGSDGVVTIEESRDMETTVDMVEGMELDQGYISRYFVTNPEEGTAEWENPLILLYDGKLSAVKDIALGTQAGFLINALNAQRPLVIIANDLADDALTTIVLNRSRGGVPILAIRTPFGTSRRDVLDDLSVLLGCKVYSQEAGDNLHLIKKPEEQLGTAAKIVAYKDRTIIVGGRGTKEKIEERAEQIRALAAEPGRTEKEKMALRTRAAKLTCGVAVVRVGGVSEVEMKEKRDRVEDALYATQAAMKEGVVPGGGVALVRCIPLLNALIDTLDGAEAEGARIIRKALSAPLRQIAKNAGQSDDVVFNRVMEGRDAFGYNARVNNYSDMLESGILDPTRVTKSALKNAASISGLMLTTDVILAENEEVETSTQS